MIVIFAGGHFSLLERLPALDGHIALATNTKLKNPNYKGANRHGFHIYDGVIPSLFFPFFFVFL
jgi:hypothetical protein